MCHHQETSGRPATILIVDDELVSRRKLQRIMESQGYQTVVVDNGPAALVEAARISPDVILLDISMPDMDGFDVCRQLKMNPEVAPVPVLFISGLAETAVKNRAFSAGAVDYVTKPFQRDEVLARVATHLRLRRLLQESEQRQKVLIEELPDVIIRFDRQGRHLSVSENITELYPLPAEKWIGKTHRELGFDKARCRFWRNLIEPVFTTAIPVEAEMLIRVPNGRRFFNLRIVPEHNHQGNISSVLGICRNITDQKTAEQALIQARKVAESASHAKTEFLANMSHELRTPLHGIIGMLHLLEDSRLTSEEREYLDLSLTSARRLNDTLSNILDFARIEQGRLVLHPTQFDLAKTCRGLMELFAAAAREKGLELLLDIHPDTPQYNVGDAARLEQILFNLVGNAIKFTPGGTIRLEVMPLTGSADHQQRLLFVISDTGIGIPEEHLQAIWRPFHQVDGSYTRKYDGAGMGLPLVQRLVRLMGGNLTMDSVSDEGTWVYLVLPGKGKGERWKGSGRQSDC